MQIVMIKRKIIWGIKTSFEGLCNLKIQYRSMHAFYVFFIIAVIT